MIKNYLKIAFRNLRKYKGYTFINTSGLSVGLACCVLIFLFVKDELSYDMFHPKAENIYRVIFSTDEDRQPTNANGSFAPGPALKEDFPEVLNFVRFRKVGQQGTKTFVKHEQNRFYEPRFFFADSTIFDVFNFPLEEGDPGTALSRPGTIVITREMARKYFKDENPIGKTLTADPYSDGGLIDFEVTGVLKNIPDNSHMHFDFLASFSSQRGDLNQFSGFEQVFTYLLLKEGATERLENQFVDFLHRRWTDDPWYTISLQPMLDIHLESHLRSEIEPNGNIVYVYIFSAVAIFILIIACINFMNLATARSAQRAREVGVRKAVGAVRSQLIRQFLSESMLLSLMSGVWSLVLIDVFSPAFNNLTDKTLGISFIYDPWLLALFIAALLIIGVLAGLYPAFFLSSYRPVQTLKGSFMEGTTGGTLRKGLVIFQFTISIVMIVATAIAYNQLRYIQTKDLGYAKEQIMVVPLNREARTNYEAIRNKLLNNAHILNTTTSSLVPTMGSSHNMFSFGGLEEELSLAKYYIDKDFVDTYGIELLAGKDVTRSITTEKSSGDFLITSKAVKEAGWKSAQEAVGRKVTWDEYEGTVSGVVNDLFIYSLRDELYSMIFFITPIQYHEYLSIKVDSKNVQQTLAYIQDTWSELVPGYPLDYFFLDQSFERMHQADMRLGKALGYFALLAIVVACLGLFGLAAFMAERRTKEIGIRKVLGATISHIVVLLSQEFLKLIAVAVLIASPIAWYFMHRWLQEFVYHVEISPMSFVWAGGIAMVIALLTISYQSVKAAFANPVESLKSE